MPTPAQPFEECVAKLLQPSKQLIQRMQADGVVLSKPRFVTHLLVGDDAAVSEASKLFAERGFDILEAAGGRLLLGDEVPLSEEWAIQTVPAMCSKAAEFGLVYDGWDVDMTNEGAGE